MPLITTPLIISSLLTVNLSADADDTVSSDILCSPFSGSSSRPPGLVVMLEVDAEEVKGKLVMTEVTEAVSDGGELGTLTHRLRRVF